MGLRINTNVASMQAQNNLSKTTKKLNQALTRLSTGLRINTGSDDVVGLAKSENLKSQIDGANRARLNISDATGVFGVAEGGLSQLTDIAQTLRTLSVNAATDTLSADDRTALNNQKADLLAEYDRLATGSNFGGVKLLDGTFNGKNLQVGTNEGDTISLTIGDARSAAIGQVAQFTAQTRSKTATATTFSTVSYFNTSSIQINGVSISNSQFSSDGVSNTADTQSAISFANAINHYSAQTGVTARASANVQTFTVTTANIGTTLASNAYLMINGVTAVLADVKSGGYAATSDDDMSAVADLINEHTTESGVSASYDSTANKLIFTASDGRNIDFKVGGTGADGRALSLIKTTSTAALAAYTVASFRGTFTLTSNDAFSISGASAEFAASASVSTSVDTTTSLDNLSFDTADDAATGISILDKVISQLQSRRADVGSLANRLDIADSELASRVENLSSANSQIRDADVAAETANYTKQNILQQAGATVLAQANSAPQIALQLLQNL